MKKDVRIIIALLFFAALILTIINVKNFFMLGECDHAYKTYVKVEELIQKKQIVRT
jgi:hypothetical protein